MTSAEREAYREALEQAVGEADGSITFKGDWTRRQISEGTLARARRILAENVVRQRPEGGSTSLWGDFPCDDCSGENFIWFTRSELWNEVMGDERMKVLCARCFIRRAVDAGIDPTGWELVPEENR